MNYTTNDAVEATALIMNGSQLLRVEPRPDRLQYCTFTLDTDEDSVFQYASGNLMVVPSLFMIRYRQLVAQAQRVCR